MARPKTSGDAWKNIQFRIAELHQRILEAIHEGGGFTDDELEQRLNLSHQTVSARTHELRKAGLIHDSGVRRRTRHGQMAAVWFLSDKAPAIERPQLL